MRGESVRVGETTTRMHVPPFTTNTPVTALTLTSRVASPVCALYSQEIQADAEQRKSATEGEKKWVPQPHWLGGFRCDLPTPPPTSILRAPLSLPLAFFFSRPYLFFLPSFLYTSSPHSVLAHMQSHGHHGHGRGRPRPGCGQASPRPGPPGPVGRRVHRHEPPSLYVLLPSLLLPPVSLAPRTLTLPPLVVAFLCRHSITGWRDVVRRAESEVQQAPRQVRVATGPCTVIAP